MEEGGGLAIMFSLSLLILSLLSLHSETWCLFKKGEKRERERNVCCSFYL